MIDRGFADKAIGNPPERMHHPGNRVGGEEDNRCLRGNSADLDGGAHAIHHGHIDVENDDIGVQLSDFLDRFFSVRSFAAYFEGMLLQKVPQRSPYYGDVIHEKHSGPHGHLCSTQREARDARLAFSRREREPGKWQADRLGGRPFAAICAYLYMFGCTIRELPYYISEMALTFTA